MKRFLPCAVALAAVLVATGQALALPSLDLQGLVHPEHAAPNGDVAVNSSDTHPMAPGAAAMPMAPSSNGTAPAAGPGTAAAPGAMPMPVGATQQPSATNHNASTEMPMAGGSAPSPSATSVPMAMPMPNVTNPPGNTSTPMPMPTASTPPIAGTSPTPTPMPMPVPTASGGAAPTATPMPMPTGTGTPATPAPVASGGLCSVVPSGQANPSDEPEPMGPIWCFPLTAGPTTRSIDAVGGWIDRFATNVQMTHLNDGEMGYRVFNAFNGPAGSMRAGTFINNNHWMVDLVDQSAFRLSGGVLLSPNRAFRFENGKLVIEADAAAGEDGAGGADVFYEVDITPAAAPTGTVVDGLYGYGQFGLVGALGCRLERSTDGGHTVCAMYDNTDHDAGRGGRTWETQGAGTARTAVTVDGGYPGYQIPGTSLHGSDVFRICETNQMDMFCRDRFRFEITKDSLTIFVNGYKWFDVQGLYASNPATGTDNRIPDSWLGPNGVHVYFTSWINSGQHTPVRFHWGRIAVNPHDANLAPVGLTAAPTYCFGDPQNTCVMH
jgi:hypothetical protein